MVGADEAQQLALGDQAHQPVVIVLHHHVPDVVPHHEIRHQIHRLGLLDGHQVGQWAHELGHVALAVGVEVPLTDLDYSYRLHSFLLWYIADGPFWDAW